MNSLRHRDGRLLSISAKESAVGAVFLCRAKVVPQLDGHLARTGGYNKLARSDELHDLGYWCGDRVACRFHIRPGKSNHTRSGDLLPGIHLGCHLAQDVPVAAISQRFVLRREPSTGFTIRPRARVSQYSAKGGNNEQPLLDGSPLQLLAAYRRILYGCHIQCKTVYIGLGTLSAGTRQRDRVGDALQYDVSDKSNDLSLSRSLSLSIAVSLTPFQHA